MKFPKVTFEHFPRGEDDPTPWRAHIEDTGTGDHHGLGATPVEALLNAVAHWRSMEDKVDAQKALSEYHEKGGKSLDDTEREIG